MLILNSLKESIERPGIVRLSEVRSWPSRTWVRTGPTPWVRVSGPVRGWTGPNFVGPGPGREWTGPWGRTRVGPGPDHIFIILVSTVIIRYKYCTCQISRI